MKKVISFSIYGENEKYLIGLLKNIILAKKFYPEWVVYIYYNNTVPKKYVEEYSSHLNVELYDMTNETLPGMLWRFFPNKGVDLFISRDADSRISLREVDAVNEWVESKKILHIMRDHPHHNYPILGGMWGIRLNSGIKIQDMVYDYFKDEKNDLFIKMKDMDFLRDRIYDHFLNDSFVHDSYFYINKHSKPFPNSLVDYHFVGEIFESDDNRNYQFNIWKDNKEKI